MENEPEKQNKHRPSRKCVVCGKIADRASFFRFAKTKDGMVAFDPAGKAPGRGAYVCREGGCAGKLKKAKGLERAFRMRIPEESFLGFTEIP